MDVNLCLDSYALCEIYYNNPKFSEYLENDFVISDLTLVEFYSVLLREKGEEVAEMWFNKLEPYSVKASMDILKKAVKFRLDKKRDISFFDAVGYVFARENGLKFVTGDKEFENFEGVYFRKK